MRTESTLWRLRAWRSLPSFVNVKRWMMVAVLTACFTTGCEALFSGEEEGEVMATIDFSRGGLSPDTIMVRAPDTIGVSQSFPVTIRTYYGCLLEEGRTRIDVRSLRAEVTPFMRTIPGRNCATGLRAKDRTVHMRFTSRGVGTVTVFGLNDITYPSFGSADTIRVERTVVVR